jgi:hypothetical protein
MKLEQAEGMPHRHVKSSKNAKPVLQSCVAMMTGQICTKALLRAS